MTDLKKSAAYLDAASDKLLTMLNEIDTEYYMQLDEIDDIAYSLIETSLDDMRRAINKLRDARTIINKQIEDNENNANKNMRP